MTFLFSENIFFWHSSQNWLQADVKSTCNILYKPPITIKQIFLYFHTYYKDWSDWNLFEISYKQLFKNLVLHWLLLKSKSMFFYHIKRIFVFIARNCITLNLKPPKGLRFALQNHARRWFHRRIATILLSR